MRCQWILQIGANLKQANYIGKLMIQVYIDAKILPLATWNRPARFVANEAANAYEIQQNALNVIPHDLTTIHHSKQTS